MALQLVYLGTPNNNDGDSLYAGGTKINANFTELYTQLAGVAGQALRIDLGTPLIGDPVSGDTLEWSPLTEQFIPSSSTMLKTLAGNTNSFLALTNNTGKAGVDEDYSGQANALELILNGRAMWNFRATTTGTTALTRGRLFIGLGNAGATSLAITTRGVTVGGIDGLVVVRNVAEESAVSSVMVSTGSSGIILHQTPIIHPDNYKASSDSSGTIIHSGFVQQAISARGFAYGTSTMTGVRGLTGGGTLAGNREFTLDPAYFSSYIDGLTYNVQGGISTSPEIVIEPGSAVHYSYSTTGETQIGTTYPNIVFVSRATAMTRTWSATALWAPTNTYASIDAPTGLNTWYYIYLIATEDGESTDFVVTTSRDYASIQTKISSVTSNWRVIRRLGAFRTTNALDAFTGGAAANIEPFIARTLAGNTLRIDYLGNDQTTTGIGVLGIGHGSSVTNVTPNFIVTSGTPFSTGLIGSSAATTATALNFSSVTVRSIPPLPGVTADINIIQNPVASLNSVFICGEPFVSSAANTYGALGRVPMAKAKPLVSAVTSIDTRVLAISPTAGFINDTTLAGSTVFGTSAGVIVRYAIVNQVNVVQQPTATPTWLGLEVLGYNLVR